MVQMVLEPPEAPFETPVLADWLLRMRVEGIFGETLCVIGPL
jgi:hypothetical protein